ncbi:hypothetical protein ABT263_25220 [Kitasatospora sp. NPDC001603]|uniref:hypothetical protein n=1 Tax=Kitasatospora sp. NPDC001603 TaxID=3154388 RepID=UPI00331A9ADE
MTAAMDQELAEQAVRRYFAEQARVPRGRTGDISDFDLEHLTERRAAWEAGERLTGAEALLAYSASRLLSDEPEVEEGLMRAVLLGKGQRARRRVIERRSIAA